LQDQLWLREELMGCLASCIITIIVVTCGLMDFKVNEGYKKTLNTYSLNYGFVLAWLWALLLGSIIMPTVVCYYYKYLAQKEAREHPNNSEERHSTRQETSEADQETRRGPKKLGLQKQHENQVRFAVQNLTCREIYSKFAAEEFTIENIKFLVAIYELRQRCNTLSVPDMVDEAKDIYETYIKEGASIEINIPDASKAAIGDKLGIARKRQTRRPRRQQQQQQEQNAEQEKEKQGENPDDAPTAATPATSQEVMKWFDQAFDEIVELIVRDSWGRFVASSLYNEFSAVYTYEMQLDKTLGRVADSAPKRSTETDRARSSKANQSSALEMHDEL
jgi:hypothetical protein